MTDRAGRDTPPRNVPNDHRRTRHWRRWLFASVLALLVLVILVVGAYVGLSAEPPLALPAAAASVPVGPIDGTWEVAPGSEAGFRVQQTVLGMSGDVVGRTDAVTGSIVVASDRVTDASFRVDLTTVKAAPQFALSLDTARYPDATITLMQPVALSSAFASGATVTSTAVGRLTMHGASHAVTLTLSGRRDGDALQLAGSIPVVFSDWGIKGPTGYGFLGSLADRGEAEFLLILRRSPSPGTGG